MIEHVNLQKITDQPDKLNLSKYASMWCLLCLDPLNAWFLPLFSVWPWSAVECRTLSASNESATVKKDLSFKGYCMKKQGNLEWPGISVFEFICSLKKIPDPETYVPRSIKWTFPHLDPLALLLYGDKLVVFVVPLCAFHAYKCLVSPAKHLQGLVVFFAHVTGGESCRICQLVSLQSWIPQVRREVSFTVRRLAEEARLYRCRLVSVTDITRNFVSLGKLFLARWLQCNVEILLWL